MCQIVHARICNLTVALLSGSMQTRIPGMEAELRKATRAAEQRAPLHLGQGATHLRTKWTSHTKYHIVTELCLRPHHSHQIWQWVAWQETIGTQTVPRSSEERCWNSSLQRPWLQSWWQMRRSCSSLPGSSTPCPMPCVTFPSAMCFATKCDCALLPCLRKAVLMTGRQLPDSMHAAAV